MILFDHFIRYLLLCFLFDCHLIDRDVDGNYVDSCAVDGAGAASLRFGFV